jgi:hypothetical protein
VTWKRVLSALSAAHQVMISQFMEEDDSWMKIINDNS